MTLDAASMLRDLEACERELQQLEVRRDAERLQNLLHPDFREVGRSGKVYNRDQVMEALSEEDTASEIWSGNYQIQYVDEDSALLLYRSARLGPDGSLDRFTLRASLWVKSDRGWQIRFHQGTPTAPFSR